MQANSDKILFEFTSDKNLVNVSGCWGFAITLVEVGCVMDSKLDKLNEDEINWIYSENEVSEFYFFCVLFM